MDIQVIFLNNIIDIGYTIEFLFESFKTTPPHSGVVIGTISDD